MISDHLKKNKIISVATALAVGLILGALFFSGPKTDPNGSRNQKKDVLHQESVWTCSMHPQIRQNTPGLCPICAMDLVLLATEASANEESDPDEIRMSESAVHLARVRTMRIERSIPQNTVHLLGKVTADERNVAGLTARFPGRIEQLYLNITGQEVTRGQKLASIYSPDLIVAQKELLEAMRLKDSSPTFYTVARSRLRLWGLKQAQIQAIEKSGEPLIHFDIFSPVSGTVIRRHIAVGDYIKEGSSLFEIINLSQVWVLFEAYESDLSWIKVGDLIHFNFPSLSKTSMTSPIRFIEPIIDPKTRVAHLRVELQNPDNSLKPGMLANGRVESAPHRLSSELLIPKSAVLWTGKRSVVFVKLAERNSVSFAYRELTLGPQAGDFYTVSSGLQEGEEIAVHGVFRIDAAAQLAGKPSMMNPPGGRAATTHQHAEAGKKRQEQTVEMVHEQFTVFGSCEMCKTRIEQAVSGLEGVQDAVWDIETQEIRVHFNPHHIDLNSIHNVIALAGHDTDKVKAPDDVYTTLPSCCHYREEERNLSAL